MKNMRLVDQIIKEPIGGAHKNREETFKTVSKAIVKSYQELKDLSSDKLVASRMDKYAQMGVYEE
jgi:acetyl-CoA carboxylase carboxyl transferase subunit alpha